MRYLTIQTTRVQLARAVLRNSLSKSRASLHWTMFVKPHLRFGRWIICCRCGWLPRRTISSDTMTSSIAASCPDFLIEGNCSSEWKKLNFGIVPPALNLTSSCFAMAGALLIILSYACFRDFRTGSRRVIAFLAMTNFFQALGCAVSSLLYLVYVDASHDDVKWCYAFDTLCQLLAFVTWWAAIASFMWTCILALYLYFALVKGTIIAINNSWSWFYGSTTLLPLPLLMGFLYRGVLGYSPLTYGGGCFVKTIVGDYHVQYSDWSTYPTLAFKVVELVAYVIVGFLFCLIFVQFRMPKSDVKVSGVSGRFFC